MYRHHSWDPTRLVAMLHKLLEIRLNLHSEDRLALAIDLLWQLLCYIQTLLIAANIIKTPRWLVKWVALRESAILDRTVKEQFPNQETSQAITNRSTSWILNRMEFQVLNAWNLWMIPKEWKLLPSREISWWRSQTLQTWTVNFLNLMLLSMIYQSVSHSRYLIQELIRLSRTL